MPGQLVQITATNADHYFKFWLQLYRDPRVNPFFFKSPVIPDETMRALYDRYYQNKNVRFFIYVDEETQQPIGTCRVTFFEGSRSHVAMLNAVAISPSMHGGGRGTQLLADVETFIRKHSHISQIELAYEGDNPAGRHVYERKSGYQLNLNYQDWWHRPEAEFRERYPWFTDERCCVKYLKGAPEKAAKLPVLPLTPIAPLKDQRILQQCDVQQVSEILTSYRREEAQEIQAILSNPEQTVYTLMQDSTPVAILSLRPYQNETRLTHAVVMPCVAFVDTVADEVVAAFIAAAIANYRQQYPDVFHIACSEEDTTEQCYTDQHSKMPRLNRILQQAGFENLGNFAGYFNETAHSGTTLHGYQCCLLNLNDAKNCVERSTTLKPSHKLKLQVLIDNLQIYQVEFSDREAYEIFRMIRSVAYPQDYSREAIKSQLEKSVEILRNSPFYNVYHEDLAKLQESLLKVIKPKKHDLYLLPVQEVVLAQDLKHEYVMEKHTL